MVDVDRPAGSFVLTPNPAVPHGVDPMASKKKQQQQKQKLRAFKKKKIAQAKLEHARSSEGEAETTERGASRPDFSGKNPSGAQSARSMPKMHRPQGG